METWRTADTRYSGAITRRLSEYSFEVDPGSFADYLQALGWTHLPTYRRNEHARLTHAGRTAVIFVSGLALLVRGAS